MLSNNVIENNNSSYKAQLLFIIRMASRYWKTPSIAAIGLSSTDKEPKLLITVPPILLLILFNINLPKSLSGPLNYFIYISGISILSSLTAGIRIKYSK